MEQHQLLEEASTVVKQQAFYLREAFEERKLREALKFSSNMLGELKTTLLSPTNYFQLFMQVFDEIRELERYFKEEYQRGRKMKELYQSVQCAGSIVPRLYLLITAGSVYIETNELKATDILGDLVQMIKGCQHPLKGLFLRYYLLKICKNKFPDKGNQYEQEDCTVDESIELILSNLKESIKLWVRLGTDEGFKKSQRKKMKMSVKFLIGENIQILSKFQGVTCKKYKKKVLPQIVDIISQYKDSIAQQYIVDCIIQGFPDQYHLATIEQLLEACTQKIKKCDVQSILSGLMYRFSQYAQDEGKDQIIENKHIFKMFQENINVLIEELNESEIDITKINKMLKLQLSFLDFSSKSYPEDLDQINSILNQSVKICHGFNQNKYTEETMRTIVKLLTTPLTVLKMTILNLKAYPQLMKYLMAEDRIQVSYEICETLVKNHFTLKTVDQTQKLIKFIKQLIVNESGDEPHFDEELELYMFQVQQEYVAKLVHLVNAEKVEEQYKILGIFRKLFMKSSEQRKIITLPSLVFAYIKLIAEVTQLEKNELKEQKKKEEENTQDLVEKVEEPIMPVNLEGGKEELIKEAEEEKEDDPPETESQNSKNQDQNPNKKEDQKHKSKSKILTKPKSNKTHYQGIKMEKLFLQVKKVIDEITELNADLGLKLNIQLAYAIDKFDVDKRLDEQIYDIASDALIIYQEKLETSYEKSDAIQLFVGYFSKFLNIGDENYDTLITNTGQYAAKLLKKKDQCKALLHCTHLFYNNKIEKQDKIFSCLKRCLKVAYVCYKKKNKNLILYVHVLNKQLYFLNKGLEKIDVDDISTCIELIQQYLEEMENDKPSNYDKITTYFSKTLKHIKWMKNKGQASDLFQPISM